MIATKRWMPLLLAGALTVTTFGGQPEPVRRTAELTAGDLTAGALATRYAANRDAAAGSELAGDERQLLDFDPHGDGLVTEVFGDLAGAERIAVVVPGSDTELDTFDRPGEKPHASPAGGARAVYAQARRVTPDARIAVIAWLGYDAPDTLSVAVANDRRARAGAGELRRLIAGLRGTGAAVSLLCHSYGSVVCGHAVRRQPVAALVVFGSPGLPFGSADDLGDTPVWATRGSADWIRRVPHVRIGALGWSLGLGADPVSPGFGARVFDSGAAGHSDYLRPGSESLRRITQIAITGDLVDGRDVR